MSESNRKAVFLSYASQDAGAAQRICATLRAAGLEVWFDQRGLVGGDQWDMKIRKEIAECALFVPIISVNTQARLEGYFRMEWKLAVKRTLTMADEKTFLLPVVIDGTHDTDALVPAEFKDVQWTRLPGGETPPAFWERAQRLLAGATHPVQGPATDVPASSWSTLPLTSHAPAAAMSAKVPVGKSIAVLPFINMSDDKDSGLNWAGAFPVSLRAALSEEHSFALPH